MQYGFDYREYEDEALRLERILYESGAAWRVRRKPDAWSYYLERRTDPATAFALAAASAGGGPETGHLTEA